jgi:hypothetical protein
VRSWSGRACTCWNGIGAASWESRRYFKRRIKAPPHSSCRQGSIRPPRQHHLCGVTLAAHHHQLHPSRVRDRPRDVASTLPAPLPVHVPEARRGAAKRQRPGGDPTLKAQIRQGASGQQDAIVTWAVEGAMKWYADPATSLQPTEKIKADTRAWRADADRILGFWDERLIADEDACILTTEMLDAFNSWLKANGHNEWSKELFGPRFAQHTETVRHRVTACRPRQLGKLSRYGWPGQEIPVRPSVYQAVRFQTASDKEKQKDGQTGQTSSETFSYARARESFQRVRPLRPVRNPRPPSLHHKRT